MGIIDRLFGRQGDQRERRTDSGYRLSDQPSPESDEQALQRYRYMLRTAPPETIEQAHEEAFARLTPDQRAQVLKELSAVTPMEERGSLRGAENDPRQLARVATRAEMRQPGIMERTFAGGGMGMGFGGMMAGSIFGSLVAGFVGSMIAQQFFDSMGPGDFAGAADIDQGLGAEQLADPGAGDMIDSADYSDFGGDFGGDI